MPRQQLPQAFDAVGGLPKRHDAQGQGPVLYPCGREKVLEVADLLGVRYLPRF